MKNLQKIVDKKKMVESIRYTAKKIKEPTKKTGTSERSMIKYISKCDWKQSRKQYEGGPNHEGYERNHYGRDAGTGWRNRCDSDAGRYALRRMPVFYRRISGRSMHGAWSGCRRCSGKY